tara:strand:- start:620 stop:898 length:279 start_codon:yes stop_codon:yes gene_type:complete
MSPEEDSRFEKDALLHKLQDEVDKFYKDNIVIPLYWREQNGRKIYDLEYMQELFNVRTKQLQEEHSEEECYACATARHTCEHDFYNLKGEEK